MTNDQEKQKKDRGKNEKVRKDCDGSAKDSTRYVDHFAEGSKGDLVQEPSGAAAYAQNTEEERRGRQQGLQDGLQDPRIPTGGGHTEEDYFALPDDLRVELIDGVFYAMASPTDLHQVISIEIVRRLADCIEEHEMEKKCIALIAPSDVALGEDRKTVVQPDVYVRCKKVNESWAGKDSIHLGAPDFVVEVLSPSNPENDLWRKRELYRRHGVREYWIIDPRNGLVYVFLFEGMKPGDEETVPDKYTFDEKIPVHISDGLCSIDFSRIERKIAILQDMDLE